MRQRKVVIADPNEEFRLSLTEALSPDFQVDHCADGAEAFSLLCRQEPDILVLELILANMDGLELIRQSAALPKPPRVMVVAGLISEFIHADLEQLGVQYAMLKSCPVSTAASRVRQIADTPAPALPYPARYGILAGEALMELGLPNGLQGYQHLLLGLPLLMQQRDRRLSKELYEDIAASCGSTHTRVEKNIRDAIHAGWNGRDPEVWNKYFPGAARCPRNKEFLFRLTDILMERVQRGE